MKKGDHSTLFMNKMLLSVKQVEEQEYVATVVKYEAKAGYIIFLLDSGKLSDLSLDAVYVCRIQTENGYEECTGRILERYCGNIGEMFEFEIQNGFYKINLK